MIQDMRLPTFLMQIMRASCRVLGLLRNLVGEVYSLLEDPIRTPKAGHHIPPPVSSSFGCTGISAFQRLLCLLCANLSLILGVSGTTL